MLSTFRSIAPYLPVPLYAENLRVQRALASAILTRNSVSECLTGCINDLASLWDMDDFQVFGKSGLMERPFAVQSIRYGNLFDLANPEILRAAKVIMQRTPLSLVSQTKQEAVRETIVTVAFARPRPHTERDHWRGMAVGIFFLVEVTLTCSTAYIMSQHDMYLATCLLVCVAMTTTITFGLRQNMKPLFGNKKAVEKDRQLTARGLPPAALDVHVVADSWNSSKLSVLCGYSSQLHALTNIPVRCTHPTLLVWACRALALVLTAQAAFLAAVASTFDDERWSSLVWLAAYFCMAMLKKALHAIIGPENVLSEQPGALEVA